VKIVELTIFKLSLGEDPPSLSLPLSLSRQTTICTLNRSRSLSSALKAFLPSERKIIIMKSHRQWRSMKSLQNHYFSALNEWRAWEEWEKEVDERFMLDYY
jgi:hypothetical protein